MTIKKTAQQKNNFVFLVLVYKYIELNSGVYLIS